MNFPRSLSRATTKRKHRTALGYARFKCRACERRFNARTGTPCNDLQYPTDIVFVAVRCCGAHATSRASAMSPSCFCSAASRTRTRRSGAGNSGSRPCLLTQLRHERRGRAGVSWCLDATYVKVAGRWCHLYRAIDLDGELLDSMLSERRDKHGARRYLRRLVEVAGGKPLRGTEDHHPTYRKTIRWILGRKVLHRRNQYLNNLTEQNHRAIKQRSYPMPGFGRFESAARFCAAFDELRQYFRIRRRGGAHVPLAEQRRLFVARWQSLVSEMAAA